MKIAYHGAGFAGWAAQPGMRTVQGELEEALERVLGRPAPLTVAGRTDTGVHAWAQVASFQVEGEVSPELARVLDGPTRPLLRRGAGARGGARRLRCPARRPVADLLLPGAERAGLEPVRSRDLPVLAPSCGFLEAPALR